jgi:chromate transporter
LPSFVLIVVLSVAYFRWGQVPVVGKLFMAFIPAVTAIIVSAAWNMGRKAVAGWREGIITVASAVVLLWLGGFYSTLMIIAVSGLMGWLWFREPNAASVRKNKGQDAPKPRLDANMVLLGSMPMAAAPLLSVDPGLLIKLLATFAGMSVMLFGGGYVFIPLIHEIVVSGHGWVTHQEFVDAIAMGQITPGPILVSAAFIGLKVAGFTGAVIATLGIYLPPALLMVLSTHMLERIKRSSVIKAALRGVRPAVVGMVAAAAFTVGGSAPQHWASVLIFAVALVALMRFRIEVLWVIPTAGVAGLMLY